MSRPSGAFLKKGSTPKDALTLQFQQEINSKMAHGTLAFFADGFDDSLDRFYLTDKRRQGLFEYDPTDTESEADNAVVLVSASGKRFKRVVLDHVNVRWWNLKADGVTDDTIEFMKAVRYWAARGGELYIPDGTYRVDMPTLYNPTAEPAITVADGVKFMSIRGTGAALKTRKGLSGVGVLRNDFSAFRLTGPADCDITVEGVFFVGSRNTETDDYNQIINNIYVPYSCRTINNCAGLFLKGFNNVQIKNCKVKNIHGRAILLDGPKYTNITACDIDEISRHAIESNANSGELNVTFCNITNIGILKETFNVDGTTYQFENDPSGKVWYTDVGDCVYHLGPNMKVSNNYFKNFNRIGICTDITNVTYNSYTEATFNTFVHDHLRLRCSNPQSSIWLEKAQRASIHNNVIRYINRAPSEALAGTAIVCAVSTRLECDFVIENNKIFTDKYNKKNLTAINTINNSGSAIVRSNRVYGNFFTCHYHTNVNNPTGERHLEQLVIENNIFTNNYEHATVACITFDNNANDNAGIPWVKRYYNKNNILKCVNKSRTNANPYASVYNEVSGNEFDGTPIDLRSTNYPEDCLFIENNKNVKTLIQKNGIPGVQNFLNVRRNEFLESVNLNTTVGTSRIAGDFSRNKVHGRVFINSFRDLVMSDNRMIGDGMYFAYQGHSSNKLSLFNNVFQLATDKIGMNFNNNNQFTFQNVTIIGNVFDIVDGAENTKGIRWANPGEKINLFIGPNAFNYITEEEINTGYNKVRKAVIPYNIPSVAAGGFTITAGSPIPGAVMGQYVQASMDVDVQGLDVRGYVSEPGLVKFIVTNPTNAAIDPIAGNVHVTVI